MAAPVVLEEPRTMWRSSKRIATAPDACTIADSNLATAERSIMSLGAPTPKLARASWDHKTAPTHLDIITRRFGLPAAERSVLEREGFVVAERLTQPSYAWAYHEIYQSQLPIYITADSILHAVYAAHDGLVAGLERRELAPRLQALLSALHCTLPTAAARYPDDVARDLDIYLVVARSLIEQNQVPSALGDAAVEREAKQLVALARAAGAMATRTLFGRSRVIDFSQYQPRSHYVGKLAPYFQAAMWLSRLELNIVSRSSRSSQPGDEPDPSETPREAVAALALADLVEASGERAAFDRFEDVFGMLAGRREDIPLPKLAELAKQAGISDPRAADVADKLRAAVGNAFQRTARIHYMPQGSTVLPAIATFIGPRIVADSVAMRPLAHSETPGRQRIRGGDIAYLLGHDRGKHHLKRDLELYPELGKNLDAARMLLANAPRTDDLYTAWLDAIRGLAEAPRGALPSFMAKPAFADLRVNSALAAFSQLRHNHVLIAGQPYGEGGCVIPDGYVEPVPAVYDAIARYADLGAAKIGALGSGSTGTRDYFVRLGQIARVLSAISHIELANQPLPAEALRWLSMVVEIQPYGSDGRPTYTGWYFDLFEDRADAIARPDLIADFFTSTAGVSYIGVGAPRLGIFVVDTGGRPRAMIGPVTRAYEYQGKLSPRLTDQAARKLPASALIAPWADHVTVAKPREPSFKASIDYDWREDAEQSIPIMTIVAAHSIKSLTIQLLDHHRVPLTEITRDIPKGTTKITLPTKEGVESYGFTTPSGFRESEQLDSAYDETPWPWQFGSYRRAYEAKQDNDRAEAEREFGTADE